MYTPKEPDNKISPKDLGRGSSMPALRLLVYYKTIDDNAKSVYRYKLPRTSTCLRYAFLTNIKLQTIRTLPISCDKMRSPKDLGRSSSTCNSLKETNKKLSVFKNVLSKILNAVSFKLDDAHSADRH